MSSENTMEQNGISSEALMPSISKADHMRGRMDAEVVLIEYGDYECACCAEAHPMVKAIQHSLGNRLCFIFRNYPMTHLHARARRAAEAAEAAGLQGKFWEMHDLFFEKHSGLSDDDIVEHAQSLGLNVARLMREVFAGAHAFRVEKDISNGKKDKVDRTPTFFVNGRRCDSVLYVYLLVADALEVPVNIPISVLPKNDRSLTTDRKQKLRNK